VLKCNTELHATHTFYTRDEPHLVIRDVPDSGLPVLPAGDWVTGEYQLVLGCRFRYSTMAAIKAASLCTYISALLINVNIY